MALGTIAKINGVASVALSVSLTALHYGSHAVIKAEDKLLSTYYSSKLYKYVSALDQASNPTTQNNPDIKSLVASAGVLYSVKPELIHALIETESSHKTDAIAFNPEGDSKYGKMRSAAHGLMQVRGVHVGSALCPEAQTWSDLYNNQINVTCGTRILRAALDNQNSLRLALSEYNGGAGCIKNNQSICKESTIHAERTLAFLAERMYTK